MNNITAKSSVKVNKSLNVVKCLAVFAIICIHCLLSKLGDGGKAIDSLCRFAVPIFFLISGYFSFFSNNYDFALKKYKSRIVKLLKLLIISNVAYLIFSALISHKHYLSSLMDVHAWLDIIIFNNSPTAVALWFIQALIYCYVIYYLMARFKVNPNKLYILIPFLLIACIIFGEVFKIYGIKIDSFIYRNFLFLGLPFFTLGYLINDRQDEITKKISDRTIVITIILGCILSIFERLTIGSSNLFIGSIPVSLMMFIWCVKYPDKLDFKVIGWIGGNLYTLMYILHPMVIGFVIKHLHINFGYLNPFMIFTITAIISTVVFHLINLRKLKDSKSY